MTAVQHEHIPQKTQQFLDFLRSQTNTVEAMNASHLNLGSQASRGLAARFWRAADVDPDVIPLMTRIRVYQTSSRPALESNRTTRRTPLPVGHAQAGHMRREDVHGESLVTEAVVRYLKPRGEEQVHGPTQASCPR